MKKVLVCIPLSFSMVHREFFFSYTDMVKDAHDNGFDVQFITSSSIYLHLNREILADVSKQRDVDYILWLDVDQIYPKDTISVLARHVDNGHLVVGGMTADKMNKMHLGYTFEKHSELYTGVAKTPMKTNEGLKQIDCMGFGGVMMHPKVLTEMLKPQYFFQALAK